MSELCCTLSKFSFAENRATKLRNINKAKYEQSSWTPFPLNPSTVFHFSTLIPRKGNFRSFQQVKIQREISQKIEIHIGRMFSSVLVRANGDCPFLPSQTSAVSAEF